MRARECGLFIVAMGLAGGCGESTKTDEVRYSGGAGRGDAANTGGADGEAGEAGEPEGGQAGGGEDGGEGGAGSCRVSSGLVITSEDDLVAFRARHCQVLEGTLTIRSDMLTSLDALGPSSPLRVITGDLVIDRNPMLESIQGLAGLEEINGSLILTDNALESLAGLDDLRLLGSDAAHNALVIASQTELASVSALAGLTRLRTSVIVSNNPALSNLEGLDHVVSTSSVTIANNIGLTELGGLTELEHSDNLTISSNPSLRSLPLPSLRTAGLLSITSHAELHSVSLPSLATAENLTIAGNLSLTSLGALTTLTEVANLAIAENPKLPQCFVDELDQRLRACNMTCSGNDDAAACD
jgi:hypothetical protein